MVLLLVTAMGCVGALEDHLVDGGDQPPPGSVYCGTEFDYRTKRHGKVVVCRMLPCDRSVVPLFCD